MGQWDSLALSVLQWIKTNEGPYPVSSHRIARELSLDNLAVVNILHRLVHADLLVGTLTQQSDSSEDYWVLSLCVLSAEGVALVEKSFGDLSRRNSALIVKAYEKWRSWAVGRRLLALVPLIGALAVIYPVYETVKPVSNQNLFGRAQGWPEIYTADFSSKALTASWTNAPPDWLYVQNQTLERRYLVDSGYVSDGADIVDQSIDSVALSIQANALHSKDALQDNLEDIDPNAQLPPDYDLSVDFPSVEGCSYGLLFNIDSERRYGWIHVDDCPGTKQGVSICVNVPAADGEDQMLDVTPDRYVSSTVTSLQIVKYGDKYLVGVNGALLQVVSIAQLAHVEGSALSGVRFGLGTVTGAGVYGLYEFEDLTVRSNQ